MKKYILISTIILLVLFVFGVSASIATAEHDVGACVAIIEQTQTDLGNTEIGGGNPDRTRASLESKLDNAIIKINQGKLEDAIGKLTDFRTAVLSLANAAKPKIAAEDAAVLVADADSAIICLMPE